MGRALSGPATLPMCLAQRFNSCHSCDDRADNRDHRGHAVWQFAIDHRGNEYRSHGESDNEIASLNTPDMVHIKRRIGEKENQIDDYT